MGFAEGWQGGFDLVRGLDGSGGERGAYECDGAEEVGVEDGPPFLWGDVGYSLHGREDPVIDDQAVDLGEGLQGKLDDLGADL